VVVVGALNLRAGPGTDCPLVGSLGFGTVVTPAGPAVRGGVHTWHRLTTPQGKGFAVADALRPLPERPPLVVPVLMYHRIGEHPDQFTVSRAGFAAQLRWLRDHGYVTITPSDLADALDRGVPLPARPVMITIDDYWAAAPAFLELLQVHGFRGTHMLPNGADLSGAEIAELAKEGEVCGHTVTHPFLPELSPQGQRAEIEENKAWLEGIVGQPVVCFAYPFGKSDEASVEIVATVGFRIAFDAEGGPARLDRELDRWNVPRVEVSGEWSLAKFAAVMEEIEAEG
jgi:peptidoglycan/xylan/chitin deacetylase (PgdA/CDA1 family)